VYGRFEKEPTMGEEAKGAKPFDPMEPWRGVRDVYLDAWAKSMVEMVNTEAYAQATGTMLDTYLTASAPFREAVEKAMLKTLEQLSMPTRADVVSIAERMTNIEMRLDDMDAKLDAIRNLIASVGAKSRPEAKTAAKAARKVVVKKTAKKGKK
jgi:polyhydroxyalkanoic acid synthase PhaR subunit